VPCNNAARVQLSVSPNAIHKGDDAVFTISVQDNCQDITVNYAMKGKAKYGVDYILSDNNSGQVFIPAGQSTATITLHALDNSRKSAAPATMSLSKSRIYKVLGGKATVSLLPK
jgi:uncharacterized protein YfaS (alpha-2-macroglobulin family)